jgi:hypothetical protein
MPAALALVPLALAVAGTAVSVAGQQKAARATAAARSKSVQQQKTLQRQADQVFNKSLDDSTPANANAEMAAGKQARMSVWNDLKSATTPIASALPATQTTTSNPTGAATARSAGGANALNNLNANAKATEGSYQDWNTAQAIKNADASRKLATINNFAGANASLLPTELGVATEAGDQLSGWGSIVSALGTISSAAGGAFRDGIPSANKTAMLNEFNGAGAAGMTGSGFINPGMVATPQPALPASNTGNIWSNFV